MYHLPVEGIPRGTFSEKKGHIKRYGVGPRDRAVLHKTLLSTARIQPVDVFSFCTSHTEKAECKGKARTNIKSGAKSRPKTVNTEGNQNTRKLLFTDLKNTN